EYLLVRLVAERASVQIGAGAKSALVLTTSPPLQGSHCHPGVAVKSEIGIGRLLHSTVIGGPERKSRPRRRRERSRLKGIDHFRQVQFRLSVNGRIGIAANLVYAS